MKGKKIHHFPPPHRMFLRETILLPQTLFRHRQTQTNGIEPEIRLSTIPGGYAVVSLRHGGATTTIDARLPILRPLRRHLRTRSIIAEPILAPLGDIACHVVDAQLIRLFGSDTVGRRCGVFITDGHGRPIVATTVHILF